MTNQGLIGIIGGSGLYAMPSFSSEQELDLETPFGAPSDRFVRGRLAGREVVFLPRHGVGHRLNPSEINFRANIWGMKSLGVEQIISVSAVGSLREEIRPGDMVIIDQFFDRTQLRPATFFEQGIVAHVSLAEPVCPRLRNQLIAACQGLQIPHHERGTYLCMEGPQFSTRAESHWYRHSVGAHVVGMTNLQEAKLAREAEICYATLALSTDYDCWREEEEAVSTEMVLKIIKQNVVKAQRILHETIGAMDSLAHCRCQEALKQAILTEGQRISETTKKRLALLLAKYQS